MHIFDGFLLVFIGFQTCKQIHSAHWFDINKTKYGIVVIASDAYKYENYIENSQNANWNVDVIW